MKILLADDHELFRDAIELLLQRDFEKTSISHANSYSSVLEQLESDTYDLVLLDYQMPGLKGIESIEEIVIKISSPVIVLSGFIDKEMVSRLFAVKVMGVIPKTMAGDTLTSAIRLVLKGAKYIPEILLANDSKQEPSLKDNRPSLTQREKSVLDMLVEGMSNKEIARTLHLEESTVKLHIRALCSKLNTKNRTGVVVQAFKQGLIEINSSDYHS